MFLVRSAADMHKLVQNTLQHRVSLSLVNCVTSTQIKRWYIHSRNEQNVTLNSLLNLHIIHLRFQIIKHVSEVYSLLESCVLYMKTFPLPFLLIEASRVAQMVKNLPAKQETEFNPWVKKVLWRREWQPTPVFLPGKLHGQRSLAGYKSMGSQRVGHD